jgi:hypothetical protein
VAAWQAPSALARAATAAQAAAAAPALVLVAACRVGPHIQQKQEHETAACCIQCHACGCSSCNISAGSSPQEHGSHTATTTVSRSTLMRMSFARFTQTTNHHTCFLKAAQLDVCVGCTQNQLSLSAAFHSHKRWSNHLLPSWRQRRHWQQLGGCQLH